MNPANGRCPRCGGGFHCGAADPAPCACAGLVLPAELLERLRREYSGCLCLDCLRRLARETPPAAGAGATR